MQHHLYEKSKSLLIKIIPVFILAYKFTISYFYIHLLSTNIDMRCS